MSFELFACIVVLVTYAVVLTTAASIWLIDIMFEKSQKMVADMTAALTDDEDFDQHWETNRNIIDPLDDPQS